MAESNVIAFPGVNKRHKVLNAYVEFRRAIRNHKMELARLARESGDLTGLHEFVKEARINNHLIILAKRDT